MNDCMLNKCISNPGCWLKKSPPFYVLKIKIYVNFYPALYSSASKTVCISMTNPYWASTQTLKSKVGISIGNPPHWHLTLHLIDTQPYCLWFISWVECKGVTVVSLFVCFSFWEVGGGLHFKVREQLLCDTKIHILNTFLPSNHYFHLSAFQHILSVKRASV